MDSEHLRIYAATVASQIVALEVSYFALLQAHMFSSSPGCFLMLALRSGIIATRPEQTPSQKNIVSRQLTA